MYKNLQLLILSLLVFSAAFYPTSKDGIINGTSEVILFNFFVLILLGILYFFSFIDKVNFIISCLIIFFLSLFTVFSIIILSSEFSIARLAIVAFPLLIFSLKIKVISNFKLLRYFFHFTTIIILVVNIIFLFLNQNISLFFIENYSQFNFFTVQSQFAEGKPVFTFGVHTFASYFYFLFIYFWNINLKFYKTSFIYYFYIISFLVFMISLNSYSSFFMTLLSILMLLTNLINKKNFSRIVGFSVFFGSFFLIAFYFIFSDQILDILFNESHGFFPRYFGNLFITNFEVVRRTFFGLGFTIARQFPVVYTDSGPIVYFTMGNVFFPIMFYFTFFRFLKYNLQKHYFYLFFFTILFELAIPVLVFLKSLILLFVIVYYQKGLNYV